MKHITRTLIFIFVLTTLLVSACAGAAAPASNAAEKVQADLVEFTGVIEAINGTQWTINGQIVTVDPSVVRDGPFQVGDTVKLEAQVAQDGSVVVTRVETPSAPAADNGNTNSADSGNTNSVDNGNSNSDSNSNSNSNDNSSTPGTTGGLVFDDSGNEAFGPVDSITADAVVIGGQTFALTNGSEFKGLIAAGDFVKVHFVLNADGTYTIVEIETWDPAAVSNGNSNSNSNDDNSNVNSNSNSNGNSNNDDDDDDDNSNDNGDDDDDDDNSNDDNSNGNSNG